MLASEENVLSLMSLLGSSEEEAIEKLATRVSLSVAPSDGAKLLAANIRTLLEHSLTVVDGEEADVELAVGTAFSTTSPLRIHIALTADVLTITRDVEGGGVADNVHGLFRKIAACYAAGNAIARALGGEQFENVPDPFMVPLSAFKVSADELRRPIILNDAVLAGAGGVGNGFIWALPELDVSGHLTIVDPKNISNGGLNRCLLFGEGDVGKPKAPTLAGRAEIDGLKVDSFVGTFSAWVKERGQVCRVFTTPDSRDARRSIQKDLPVEVLDASTTDLSEVVLHSHRQPAEGACLACIYPHIPVEDLRARHVAEGLGLSLDEVREGFISPEVAKKLAGLHTGLDEQNLVGQAFDTVYKGQCGEGVLLTEAGKQAVAPLAFISNLAGALLALELVRFERTPPPRESFYMAVSPWCPPSVHALRSRDRLPECEFCGNEQGLAAMRMVWPEVFEQKAMRLGFGERR